MALGDLPADIMDDKIVAGLLGFDARLAPMGSKTYEA